MTNQNITIGISVLTVVSGAINVYVGLRLSALQSKMKADSAATLMKQFVTWKDELLQLLNGKMRACHSRGRNSNGLRARHPAHR